MGLKLIVAPAVQPLTMEEVKRHLRVIDSDEDDLIRTYMRAALGYVEGEYGWTGRALVTQTWQLTLDKFPSNEIHIPLPPLQEVVNIRYDDVEGTEQFLHSPGDFYVDSDSEDGWVVPLSQGWPATLDAVNAVRVTYVAGYSPTTDSPPNLTANIPFEIKAAMLLIIGGLYQNRENMVVGTIANALPFGVENLLRPHRVKLGMA